MRMIRKSLSRRAFLTRAGAAAIGMAGTGHLSAVSAFATPRGDGDTARSPVPYGAAVRGDMLVSDAGYRAAVAANCQMIVPESELKWLELRPTRAAYSFEKADAMLDFARASGITMRGHTLAWYGALPDWIKDIASRAEAERELTTHIETVMSRYRGAIRSWDVVNEPIANDPGDGTMLRRFAWSKWLGPDYLAIAFKAAGAADPGAQLVLNEYDVEFRGSRFAARRRALLRQVRLLRERDVPLHAIGLQAHLFADRAIDRDGLQALLSEFAALKLDILITELDVIDYELPGPIGERDALVAAKAREFLQAVTDVVRPRAILTWGLSDRYTWVPTYFKRPDGMPNRPLPLDAELRRKPLFDVIETFRRKTA